MNKKTRNMVTSSLRAGAKAECVEKMSETTCAQVLRIFKETPFREGRFFPGYYTWTSCRVRNVFRTNEENVSVIATWKGKVVGVSRVRFNDQVAALGQLMSSVEARRGCRGISNLMIAKLVELLAERGVRYLVYGKFGVIPSLDRFKLSNGFRPVTVNYNYVLLSAKARGLAALGLHRRPDILLSSHPWSISLVTSLQRLLPLSFVLKFGLYA